jgi:hypothetical protein
MNEIQLCDREENAKIDVRRKRGEEGEGGKGKGIGTRARICNGARRMEKDQTSK